MLKFSILRVVSGRKLDPVGNLSKKMLENVIQELSLVVRMSTKILEIHYHNIF